METGGRSLFFNLIDNKARNEALAIVVGASDAADLLDASRQHFNQRVSSLSADRILGVLADDQLSPLLREVEGFDPELFKAVVLFELSHLEADEVIIPSLVDDLARFWTTAHGYDRQTLERRFTAETRRTRYIPFSVISHHVLLSIITAHDESIQSLGPRAPNEEDPLAQELDGKKRRISIGGRELAFEEHPVLTEQLYNDLHKLFPAPIIRELQYRFPDEGTFEEIQPLIEKIQQERREGIVPSAKELLSGYRRWQRRVRTMFGRADTGEMDIELQLRAAVESLQTFHRRLEARTHTREVYVLESREWFTIRLVESEIEPNVLYRRVYFGDIYAKQQKEVPIEAREPVITELLRERQETSSSSDQERPRVVDVYGSF